MNREILIDTGPLVALLNGRDLHHDWAVEQFHRLSAPLLTCEAVIAEAMHLVGNVSLDIDSVLTMVSSGAIEVRFRLGDEVGALANLVRQYRDIPMDLADGCLTRMCELFRGSRVMTLDSHFNIYRRDRDEPIAVIMP